MKIIDKKFVKKHLPKRDPSSHKGQNGRVLVIGGSRDYHGAPIFNALGALRAGADLVTLFVPKSNADITKSFSPDFIVKSWQSDDLSLKDLNFIKQTHREFDSIIIGSGMSRDIKTLRAIKQIIETAELPIILDAAAIQILKNLKGISKNLIITPHEGEFRDLINKNTDFKNEKEKISALIDYAKSEKVNILFKNPTDIIVSNAGEVVLNKTGNAGMTVGGTGDLLAGLTAGFAAQKLNLFNAAALSAYVLGKAGERLFRERHYSFTTSDLAKELGENSYLLI